MVNILPLLLSLLHVLPPAERGVPGSAHAPHVTGCPLQRHGLHGLPSLQHAGQLAASVMCDLCYLRGGADRLACHF